LHFLQKLRLTDSSINFCMNKNFQVNNSFDESITYESLFAFLLRYQLMIKNAPNRLINSVKINVTRKKLLPPMLKNQIIKRPRAVITTPPINSHFQATKVRTNSNSHGNALGLLCRIALKLISSAPDSKAKMKTSTATDNNKYLDVYLRIFANKILFFIFSIFRAPVFNIFPKNFN